MESLRRGAGTEDSDGEVLVMALDVLETLDQLVNMRKRTIQTTFSNFRALQEQVKQQLEKRGIRDKEKEENRRKNRRWLIRILYAIFRRKRFYYTFVRGRNFTTVSLTRM